MECCPVLKSYVYFSKKSVGKDYQWHGAAMGRSIIKSNYPRNVSLVLEYSCELKLYNMTII